MEKIQKNSVKINEIKVVEHEILYNCPPVASPAQLSNAGL